MQPQARRDSNPQQAVLETAALANWSYWPNTTIKIKIKTEKRDSLGTDQNSDKLFRKSYDLLFLLFVNRVFTTKRAKLTKFNTFMVQFFIFVAAIISLPTGRALKLNEFSHNTLTANSLK